MDRTKPPARATAKENIPGIKNAGDVSALLKAAAVISGKVDIVEVAKEGARQVVRALKAGGCAISHWNRGANTVALWAEHLTHEEETDPKWFKPYPLEDYPLTLEVLQTGKCWQVREDDAAGDAAELGFMEEARIKALLLIPILAHGQITGLMEIFEFQEARTFTDEEVAVAEWLANHVGIAIQRSQLLAEERQRAAELEALRQASLSVTASLNLDEVLHAILESTLDLSQNALDAHIFLYDGETLAFGAALWADRTENKAWSNPRENGLTYSVARSGEMYVIPDSAKHAFYQNKPENWDDWSGGIVGMPLKIGDNVVGVMNIAYDQPREFSENEVRIFQLLADQAALAIENARLHDLVSQQALTDPLTELPNRRALENRIKEEFEQSKRYQHGFTLMMIDLNDFKRVNDAYGHTVGDEALRQVAVCMLGAIRESDFLARVGGDEFMLLLPETGKDKAAQMHKKVKQILVNCSMEWNIDEFPDLSLSVGMAHYPEDGKTLEELTASADAALYKEKNKASG